ncbi:DUF4912 domain-containing protein [Scytonema hofmannii FACHB-248]|uniref:DUF4912 domain-containing protein n=1 Tax=Scytonema hofmannii FACHB-248 TaxID=1842502 RepID=A0ABR8GSK9_9CYAN|nr:MULTISPECIES: substrate-binding domain-containing protein [Nostocales]MBD2606241.1 DUF4912 domain-containing protein [Scytonema hofmannii FACHB-248]
MWQKEKKDNSIVSLALLLALTSPAVTLFVLPNCVQAAQAATEDPSFPLPKTVENNTKIRIDGSSGMMPINQSLKESFEKQFSGSSVELAANGADSGLKALQDGKIDIATIARDLTPQEKAQGLEQLHVRREKIAIVVGAGNAFKGNLTSRQFAKIFRGEITNWSEVGGRDGKIRFIDRPSTSDTRESLRDYPVFKSDKFATGSTATQLADDNTAEVIKQLGKNGISYVLVNQISKLQDVRSLKLHNTSPDDARYPFSQPLVYVYKKNPSLGIAAYLGFATAKPGIEAIEEARTSEANAIAASILQTIPPNPITSATTAPSVAATSPLGEATNPTTTTTTNQNNSPIPVAATDNIGNVNNETISPWWWLLALPVIGGFLWWLLGKRRTKPQPTDNVTESLEETIPTPTSASVATPPVSEALSDNQLLRAYAQTQSGTVENTTHISDNLPQGVTNTADHLAEDTTSPVSNITPGGSAALAGVTAAGIGTSVWFPPSKTEAVDDITDIPQLETPNDITDIPQLETSATDQTPEAQSNTSGGGTIAPSESTLWSRLTGSSPREVIAESTESDDLEEDVWNIETPPTEVTTPKLQYSTTVDASAIEVRDSLPLAFDEVENSPLVASNPEASIIEITPAETQIPTSASNEVENSPLVASNPQAQIPTGGSDVNIETSTSEQPDVSDEDVETSTREITASFPELASPEDDWDMEFAQDDTEAQPAAQFNWLQNITSAGGAVAAGTGAVLWSRSPNRNSQTEATNQTTQINDAEEDFWDIETPPIESPDVAELANVESPTGTQITDSVPELPNVPELLSDEDDWDMEFAQDETEVQPAQSNWLDSIISPRSGVVAGGAVLWSRLSGKGSQTEADDTTTESSNIDEDFGDIETPVTQQADVPLSVLNSELPTVEIIPATQQPDVALSALNSELPTVEIIPATQQPDVALSVLNPELPTVEIIPAMPELLDVPEAALDVVADAAEEDLSDESNWLENTTSADDATMEDDVSSDWFDIGETTSLSSPESRETSAEVTDTSLELTANLPITEDINETVTQVPEPVENVTIPRPLDLAAGAAFVGVGAWSRIYGIREHTEKIVNEVTNDVESSIAIAPRTAKWAYVSWNVSEEEKKSVQQEGVCQLALRLYDVTDIDLSYQTPTLVQQYECEEITHDRYVAIPVSDRDYIAEIGYLINSDRWFLLARSATVRVSNRPQQGFWFQADAELIIHGATEPGATVTIGGHSIKLKPDGTFHLRVPFTDKLIDYLMTAVTSDEQETKIIHKKFFQESQE